MEYCKVNSSWARLERTNPGIRRPFEYLTKYETFKGARASNRAVFQALNP